MSEIPKDVFDIDGYLVFIDEWLMSTDVIGVFGEVSKVFPLWHSYKNGPHGKML
jgi:hypothetical protein